MIDYPMEFLRKYDPLNLIGKTHKSRRKPGQPKPVSVPFAAKPKPQPRSTSKGGERGMSKWAKNARKEKKGRNLENQSMETKAGMITLALHQARVATFGPKTHKVTGEATTRAKTGKTTNGKKTNGMSTTHKPAARTKQDTAEINSKARKN